MAGVVCKSAMWHYVPYTFKPALKLWMVQRHGKRKWVQYGCFSKPLSFAFLSFAPLAFATVAFASHGLSESLEASTFHAEKNLTIKKEKTMYFKAEESTGAVCAT